MVQVPGMEWRHIDQRAVRSQPDGVVYRDQITGARNLYNLPVIEHPAELHPATGLFNLAADILEAVRRLRRWLRTILRETERLPADRSRKRLNVVGHFGHCKHRLTLRRLFAILRC